MPSICHHMPSLPSIVIQGVPLVSQLVSITPRVNIGVFHKDLVRTLRIEFCTVQALYEFPESAACLSPEEQNRRLAGIARPKTLSKVK